jgi:hypothetical protein
MVMVLILDDVSSSGEYVKDKEKLDIERQSCGEPRKKLCPMLVSPP